MESSAAFEAASDSPPSQFENEKQTLNSSGESESFKQLLADLKEYEENQPAEESIPTERPVIGCFEIVASCPKSLLSLSIDGDEEREILKCSEARGKSTEKRKVPDVKKSPIVDQNSRSKIPARKTRTAGSVQMLNHQEIQTSGNYFVNDEISSSKHNRVRNHSLCTVVSTSRMLPTKFNYSGFRYANGGESDCSSTESNSLYAYFKNNKFSEESDSPHYTPITVSATPSPPDSPPKKGAASFGCRIKFTSVYNADGSIPPQMESLAMFEVEASSSDDELPTDRSRRLPRFPVRCPITSCESFSVPSDFCNHITIDHPYIDVKKVEPKILVNMRINPKGNANMVICHQLFLLSGKIR